MAKPTSDLATATRGGARGGLPRSWRTPAAIVVCGLALALLAIPGCSSDDPQSGSGNVNIFLTDAPIDLSNVSEVNVTFDELTLYPAGGNGEGEGEPVEMDLGPITIAGEATVNLLDYTDGATILMAAEDVPEGPYKRIRLGITASELLMDDDGDPETPDVVEAVFVPSNKIDVLTSFVVEPGDSTDITLDFDAAESVHLNETPGQHRFILRPVINRVR